MSLIRCTLTAGIVTNAESSPLLCWCDDNHDRAHQRCQPLKSVVELKILQPGGLENYIGHDEGPRWYVDWERREVWHRWAYRNLTRDECDGLGIDFGVAIAS